MVNGENHLSKPYLNPAIYSTGTNLFIGSNPVAEGYTLGISSLSVGQDNKTGSSVYFKTLFGYGLRAANTYSSTNADRYAEAETVVGRYNWSGLGLEDSDIFLDSYGEYYPIFTIGCGYDDSYRQNAFQVICNKNSADPVTLVNNTLHITRQGLGYGGSINFGDSDYVHIKEAYDDTLEIKTSRLYYAMSTGHTITDLDMRYPYTVASISAATTMGINNTYLGVVGTGTNVIAIVYNSSSSAKTLTLPSSVSGYSARRNTSSISIPAYGFGEVAVLKAGTTLYIRATV